MSLSNREGDLFSTIRKSGDLPARSGVGNIPQATSNWSQPIYSIMLSLRPFTDAL